MLCLTLLTLKPRPNLSSVAAGGNLVLLFRWGAEGCISSHPSLLGRTTAATRTIQEDAQVSNWFTWVLSARDSTYLMLSSPTFVCVIYTHIPQLPGASRTLKIVSSAPISIRCIVSDTFKTPMRLVWGQTSAQVAQDNFLKTDANYFNIYVVCSTITRQFYY
jgi:hypothetical protein